ncbi:MAG: bis(5'-nucleosyl)-tetraphosphatase (symmetrical) YqeK [Bacillota bacterium]|nr:bis(5'-nucleosyl)-tetraphosphatase (symmetrical) YqeK [Bacillota bacterium]
MLKPDYYQNLIKEHLGDKLYRHSLSVADSAEKLAIRHGADAGRAYLAGVVHDYGKPYSHKKLLELAVKLELRLDRITRGESRLLHAPVGAALLRSEHQLDDPEVIQAVTYHTTGRPGMSLLEKVVYLADYIEIGRNYKGVEIIREVAFENLDRAMLKAVEIAICSIIERGLLLHPRSVALRNCLLAGLRT